MREITDRKAVLYQDLIAVLTHTMQQQLTALEQVQRDIIELKVLTLFLQSSDKRSQNKKVSDSKVIRKCQNYVTKLLIMFVAKPQAKDALHDAEIAMLKKKSDDYLAAHQKLEAQVTV